MILQKYPDSLNQRVCIIPKYLRGHRECEYTELSYLKNFDVGPKPPPKYLPLIHYILLLGSYKQCSFLLRFLQETRLRRLPKRRRCIYHRYQSRSMDGEITWGNLSLTAQEYHYLLFGLIQEDRRDRRPLWDVVTSQVAKGHTVNWYYLRLALFNSNDFAVKELLARGWCVNGPLWARFMTPLDLAERSNRRTSVAILKNHGAKGTILHKNLGRYLIIVIYPAIYILVIPLSLIFANPIPDWSNSQKVSGAYGYSFAAMICVPLPYFFSAKWLWNRPGSHWYTWIIRYIVAPLTWAWFNVALPVLFHHKVFGHLTVTFGWSWLCFAAPLGASICIQG